MSSGIPLGPGFKSPTANDHRAWLWVCTFLSLIYSFLCFGARLMAKWDLFWYDDAILGVAYMFGVIHWGLIFSSLSNGLGVSTHVLSTNALRYASTLYFASRIPMFIALCLSKVSVLVFTRRIFTGDLHGEHNLFSIAYTLATLYGILAVLLSSAGCKPAEALTASPNAVCKTNAARWGVIITLEVLTEFMLLAIPIFFISKNELRASKKSIVIFVFSFRIVVAACAVASVTSYGNFVHNEVTNIGMTTVVVLQEILLCLSLLTASIPCLKPFVWAFMSRHLETMYGTPNPSTRQDSITQSRPPALRLRPEWMQYNVDVRASSSRDPIVGSSGLSVDHQRWRNARSDRMVILRDVNFAVMRD